MGPSAVTDDASEEVKSKPSLPPLRKYPLLGRDQAKKRLLAFGLAKKSEASDKGSVDTSLEGEKDDINASNNQAEEKEEKILGTLDESNRGEKNKGDSDKKKKDIEK